MELIQFTAIVLMTGLTLKLLLLPRRVDEDRVTGRSRCLLLVGTALLGVQFVLQLLLGLRSLGVTQAVVLNLTFFTLVSWLLSLAILRLLTRGRLRRRDAWLGGGVWTAEMVLIIAAAMTEGEPLLSDSHCLRTAERVGSVLYFAMQCYYCWRNLVQMRRLHQNLEDYYDNDVGQRLEWMRVSICVLAVLSLFVPAVIFAPGRWLMVFAVMFFYGMWYLVDSFCDYVEGSMPRKVAESEEIRVKSEEFLVEQSFEGWPGTAEGGAPRPEADSMQRKRVEAAIAQWTARGGYLRSGLNKSLVADQMGVSVNLLSRWLRQRDQKFWDWLSDLRIEAAKHIISQHHDWTNEAIAEACGFNDRSAFQKKFKQKTGLTPAEWARQGGDNHTP